MSTEALCSFVLGAALGYVVMRLLTIVFLLDWHGVWYRLTDLIPRVRKRREQKEKERFAAIVAMYTQIFESERKRGSF